MSLFSLMATLGLDTSGYDKGLDEAEGKASNFGSSLKNGLATAAKAGAAAITAASTAVVGFGLASLKTGMEFDSSMSQIAATLGITTDDIKNNVNGAGDTFDALRKKAQEMGAATNFSASQAADGLNILAMSGFSATDSIEMVEDVLHLAAAGSMDMASAAGYVAGALKGFGGSAEDAGYYADLMAKGATLANTSVSQLGDAMSSGAAGAAAYGQSADSMTLALLRLAEQGDVGAAAGTALSAAMKNLYTPTDQAKKAMTALGVSAYTADGKARDFNDVVNDLSKSMEGMTAEEQANYKSTIFGIQGLDAYNKMTVTGIDKQKQWADALAHASDGIGETAKQYETMTDNMQGDLDILSSAFDGLKIAVSDTLMDSAREFVQFGSDALSQLTAGFQNGGIEGAMEVLGGLISDGLGLIMSKVPDVVSAGMQLLTAFISGIADSSDIIVQSALDAVGVLADALVANPNTIIDAAFQIINALVTWIGEYSPYLIETAGELIASLAVALTSPDNITALLENAAILVRYLAEGIISAIPHLTEGASQIVQNFIEILTESLPMLLEQGAFLLKELTQGILDSMPFLVSAVEEILSAFTGFISENLPAILDTGMTLLSEFMAGIIEALPQISGAVQQVLDAFTGFITENLPLIIDMGISLIKSLSEGIIENLPAVIDAVLEIINGIADFVTENLPLILELGIELITSLIDGLMDMLPTLIDSALDILMAVLDFITDNLPMVIEMGMTLLSSLAQGVLDNMPEIISAITDVIFALAGWVIDNLPMIIQLGIDLIFSLAQGLLDNIPAVISAITQVIESLLGWVVDNLPMIIEMGITVIQNLAHGLLDNIPAIISAISEIILSLVGWITDNLSMIIDSGIELIMSLVEGLIGALPELIPAALEIIMAIVSGLLDNIPQLITAAIELMIQLAIGLVQAIPQIVARIPEIITGIVDAFINFDWAGLGGQIIEGIKNGILNIGSRLWEGVKSVGQGLLNGFKNLFGIASPSKVMRDKVGKMLGLGLAEGIKRSSDEAVKSAEKMAEDVLDEMDTLNGFGTDMTANLMSDSESASRYGMNGGSVVINVYGAEGQDVNELAEIISEKMAFQYRQEQMAWA